MQMLPPDAAAIATLAERALAAIPATLRRHMENVVVAVEELAEEEVAAGLDVDVWDLTGLYQGTPLHRRSHDAPAGPDLIVLYRLPILLEWIEDEVPLDRLVANVIVHEAAHHFGFSDEEIARLEGEGEG